MSGTSWHGQRCTCIMVSRFLSRFILNFGPNRRFKLSLKLPIWGSGAWQFVCTAGLFSSPSACSLFSVPCNYAAMYRLYYPGRRSSLSYRAAAKLVAMTWGSVYYIVMSPFILEQEPTLLNLQYLSLVHVYANTIPTSWQVTKRQLRDCKLGFGQLIDRHEFKAFLRSGPYSVAMGVSTIQLSSPNGWTNCGPREVLLKHWSLMPPSEILPDAKNTIPSRL